LIFARRGFLFPASGARRAGFLAVSFPGLAAALLPFGSSAVPIL